MFSFIGYALLLLIGLCGLYYLPLVIGAVCDMMDRKVQRVKARYTERQLQWFGRSVVTSLILFLAWIVFYGSGGFKGWPFS